MEENPAKHPIIILKDVPFQHLTAILEFMYAGEVNVAQDQLPQFLKTAERLKVNYIKFYFGSTLALNVMCAG